MCGSDRRVRIAHNTRSLVRQAHEAALTRRARLKQTAWQRSCSGYVDSILAQSRRGGPSGFALNERPVHLSPQTTNLLQGKLDLVLHALLVLMKLPYAHTCEALHKLVRMSSTHVRACGCVCACVCIARVHARMRVVTPSSSFLVKTRTEAVCQTIPTW